MTDMSFSPILARKIRAGDIWEYAIPTHQKLIEALKGSQTEEAISLANYSVETFKIIYDLYDQWIAGLKDFFSEEGVSYEEIQTVTDNLLDLVKMPDGAPFIPDNEWKALLALQNELTTHIESSNVNLALAAAEMMRESWRRIHDRYVDWIYGYLDFASKRFGEGHVEKAFRFIIEPFFNKRYARFNLRTHPWNEMVEVVLYLAAEAMHSHLVGPKRDGEFELTEEEDRWVFKFNPCGSGGRSLRGDVIEGTGPRMEPPYNYAVTKEEHPWSWGQQGVCYYCTQCCLLMEKMPIENWGYPVRVVEPPTYPELVEAKCTWYVYKDLDQIPEKFYTRLGHQKPPATKR